MSDKEFTKETNLNSALQGKPLRNLKEILRLYEKDRLIEYYNVITKYDVSGSKQSIVNQIYDTLTDENIELLIGVIVETFRQGYEDGILFLNEMFEEEGININEKNIDEIMGYVNDIVNNISVWGNKGWTNKEIILGKCYE